MKTVLITGGTAGIGKVTATTLAKQNYHVVIVGRNAEKTAAVVEEIKSETANQHVEYLLGDLSVMEDARKVGNEFNAKYEHLHILINNAGGVFQKRELTAEGYEKTFATNHLSHFILTHLLLDKIKKSAPARIINVSSMSHYQGRWNPDDIHLEKKYFVMWAYSNSKLYNVLFTKYLAEQLKNDGVTVNALHPGVVKTKIGGKNTKWWGEAMWNLFTLFKGISEEDGAKTSLYLATSSEVENITGKYFDKCKEKEPAAIANDKKAAEELWKLSLQLGKI